MSCCHCGKRGLPTARAASGCGCSECCPGCRGVKVEVPTCSRAISFLLQMCRWQSAVGGGLLPCASGIGYMICTQYAAHVALSHPPQWVGFKASCSVGELINILQEKEFFTFWYNRLASCRGCRFHQRGSCIHGRRSGSALLPLEAPELGMLSTLHAGATHRSRQPAKVWLQTS